jgi:hypothetical protein
MNEVGISVLTIKNEDLISKCKAPTDNVYLYVSVQAANELINKTSTLIHFAVTNQQNVIFPLNFASENFISN